MPSAVQKMLRTMLRIAAVLIASQIHAADETPQAAQVRALLERHCFECHGKNPRNIGGDLPILSYSALTDSTRKLVVPKEPATSFLIERVLEPDDNARMPPAPRPRLTRDEIDLLQAWIAAGAPEFVSTQPATPPVPAVSPVQLAASVKAIFRTHCQGCHDVNRPTAGVAILDRESLVKRRKVLPGDSDQSRLFKLITTENLSQRMPPEGKRPLSYPQIDSIRQWIAAGAPAFPPDLDDAAGFQLADVGNEALLGKLLRHQRSLPPLDRIYWRYFSTNHLALAGATRDDLNLQRNALAKAVNHLSREPEVAAITVIDPPFETLFGIDIRRLGWHRRPYHIIEQGRPGRVADFTIYDLALLEYPYAAVPLDSDVFNAVAHEFLLPAHFIRPIPFLRADWFVSVITQPPLYEDFLQLPFSLGELEADLGVDVAESLRSHTAIRSGMTVSGVSKNNRVVEHHPSREGSYWKSIDFSASKGLQNMFLDPVNLRGVGGEIVFTLPNGLNGYYLADAAGRRLEEAPTEIVTDKFAEDKIVRNGLACMRCHDEGVKAFTDTVRPALLKLPGRLPFDKVEALELYRPAAEMDQRLEAARKQFVAALEQAVGEPQVIEPLAPVSHRFLDEELPLKFTAGELGLTDTKTLEPMFRLPQFATLGLVSLGAPGGSVRRDAWEDYFPLVARDLGLGEPVVPLDAVTRDDFPPAEPPFDVTIATNKRSNLFQPGEGAVVLIANHSPTPLYARLIFTGTKLEKATPEQGELSIAPGTTGRFPPTGEIRVQPSLGKEKITVLVSDQPLPRPQLLRGPNLTDRLVHPFFTLVLRDGRLRVEYTAERVVKRTLVIETR